jgi:hypothetical protein
MKIEPAHGVRIIASGDVDESLLDALEVYLKLQKRRLTRQRQSKSSSIDSFASESTGNKESRVSFLVTQEQKAQLRQRDYSDDDIAQMKPAEAHRILGVQ